MLWMWSGDQSFVSAPDGHVPSKQGKNLPKPTKRKPDHIYRLFCFPVLALPQPRTDRERSRRVEVTPPSLSISRRSLRASLEVLPVPVRRARALEPAEPVRGGTL